MCKIYYANGFTYIGPPEDAPKFGVVAIMQKRTDGRYRVAHRADFYLYDNHWLELDIHGLVDYSINKPGHLVIAGRTVDPVKYDEIMQLATEDMKLAEVG